MSSSAPLASAFSAPLLPVAAQMLPQQQPVPVAVASKPAEDEPTCDEIVEDRSKAAQGLIKRYRRGKLLGKGGFAKCYELISMDSGRTYAGKVVPKSTLQKSSAKKKLLNEIKIHKSLDHANIVHFERFFEDKTNVYILLEVCPSQTMMELIKRRKRLSEPEVRYYMLQLVRTIRHLHKHQVIHRDLKLGNLFLNESLDIKLGDFGLAARLEFDGERKKTVCGTPNYIAPEILDGKDGHSFEVDIWSLGVIMYTLLIGKPPFETSNVKSTYKRIKANEYSFPSFIQVSSEATDLVRLILHLSPEHRPSLEQIESHPFLRGETPRVMPAAAHSMQPIFKKSDLYFPQPALFEAATASSSSSSSATSSTVPHFSAPHTTAGPCLPSAPSSAFSQPVRPAPVAAHSHQPFDQENQATLSNSAAAPFALGLAATRPSANPFFNGSAGQPTAPISSHFASAFSKPAADISKPLAAGQSDAMLVEAPLSALDLNKDSHDRNAAAAAKDAFAFGARQANEVVHVYRVDASTRGPSAFASAGNAGSKALSLEEQTKYPSAVSRPLQHQHQQQLQPADSAWSHAAPHSQAAVAFALKPFACAEPSQQHGAHSAQSQMHQDMQMDVHPPASGNNVNAVSSSPADTPNGMVVDEDDSGSLRELHNDLESSIARHQASPSKQAGAASHGATPSSQHLDVWVSKWVDYSEKYGLGYLLSSGACGVYFNDSSRIVLLPDSSTFEYQDRRPGNEPIPIPTCHTLQEFPQELHKKATLLKHFRKYLMQHSNKPTPTVPALQTETVYVKRWLRTKHAILFRLSNRTVQVNFMDHTEIILASAQNLATFTDKAGVRTSYALDSMLEQCPSPELYRRIKYTKEILAHMLNTRR